MNFGNLEGLVNGTEQVVFDSEVTGSAVPSISTGNILNGNEDGWYTIIVRHVGVAGVAVYFNPNNDTNISNYGFRGISAVDTAVANSSAPSYGGLYVGASASGKTSFSVSRLYAKSGAVRLMNTFITTDCDGTTVGEVATYGQVWSNTADNIVSGTFGTTGSSIGVGTRIIILKSNNFTNGTPTGVITTPYVKRAWVKVKSELLAAPATFITFSDLDGDRDVIYKLSFYGVDASGGSTNVALIQFGTAGGLDTGSTYGTQRVYATDTTIGASRDVGTYFGLTQINGAGANGRGVGHMLLFAKSGFVRPNIIYYPEGIEGTAVNAFTLRGNSWNNTADKITSMRIASGQTNGFAAGTIAELYALRPNG